MYQQLCSKTGLTNGGVAYSDPIQLGDYNTVQIEMTVFTGEVRVTLQEANDFQDWTVKDTFVAVMGPAYKLLTAKTITSRQVRVMWEESTGSGTSVVSGGINCSKQ